MHSDYLCVVFSYFFPCVIQSSVFGIIMTSPDADFCILQVNSDCLASFWRFL